MPQVLWLINIAELEQDGFSSHFAVIPSPAEHLCVQKTFRLDRYVGNKYHFGVSQCRHQVPQYMTCVCHCRCRKDRDRVICTAELTQRLFDDSKCKCSPAAQMASSDNGTKHRSTHTMLVDRLSCNTCTHTHTQTHVCTHKQEFTSPGSQLWEIRAIN